MCWLPGPAGWRESWRLISARSRDGDARRRARALQSAQRFQAAPEADRGMAMLVMWANAVVEVILTAALAVLIPLTARRIWRHRRSGPARALRGGPAATLLCLGGMRLAWRQVVRRWLQPAVNRRLGIPPETVKQVPPAKGGGGR